MFRSTLFWYGVALAPVVWLIVLSLAGFSYRQGKAVKEWYIGLPIVQWPAMLLLVIGCKFVRTGKHCRFMPYDGRFWLSPNVKGFELPDDTDLAE